VIEVTKRRPRLASPGREAQIRPQVPSKYGKCLPGKHFAG
jgi:hypothetical protein